jgi:CubicO group peptidase (beta-lactamase class C family)
LVRFVKPYSYENDSLKPVSTMFAEGAVSNEQTYCEGAIGLNGPIEDYAKFCQMMLNKGSFNGNRILKPETIELMTTVNQLPKENSGGEGFRFGLGFELYNEQKKTSSGCFKFSLCLGGMYGTAYIIDPEYDMIALFYMNMRRHDPLYPLFLGKVYEMVKN